jgi:acyl-CoA dehydrogenase
LPNIRIFKEQIALLVELLITAAPDKAQIKDIDFLLNLGELFTLVAYGQLLIEKARIDAVDDDLMDQIFDCMIRDFSKFALQLYSKTSSTHKQMALCMRMIKKPTVNPERFERIWAAQVYGLRGAYRMND